MDKPTLTQADLDAIREIVREQLELMLLLMRKPYANAPTIQMPISPMLSPGFMPPSPVSPKS